MYGNQRKDFAPVQTVVRNEKLEDGADEELIGAF